MRLDRHRDGHAAKAIGKQHLCADSTNGRTGFGVIDQGSQPPDRNGRVVVQQRDVIDAYRKISHTDIAATSETVVVEFLPQNHPREIPTDHGHAVINRGVVNDQHLVAVLRIVEVAQTAEAGGRQVAAVKAQDHNPDKWSAHTHRVLKG